MEISRFVWSDKPLSLREFSELFYDRLPLIVRIEEVNGANSEKKDENKASESVYFVHSIHLQSRVVARTNEDEQYISIPNNYPHKFHVLRSDGTTLSEPKTLVEVLKMKSLDPRGTRIQMAHSDHLTMSENVNCNIFGPLTVTGTYNEKYLLTVCLNACEWTGNCRLTALPTYLPLDVRLPATGIGRFQKDLEELRKRLLTLISTDNYEDNAEELLVFSQPPNDDEYEFIFPSNLLTLEEQESDKNESLTITSTESDVLSKDSGPPKLPTRLRSGGTSSQGIGVKTTCASKTGDKSGSATYYVNHEAENKDVDDIYEDFTPRYSIKSSTLNQDKNSSDEENDYETYTENLSSLPSTAAAAAAADDDDAADADAAAAADDADDAVEGGRPTVEVALNHPPLKSSSSSGGLWSKKLKSQWHFHGPPWKQRNDSQILGSGQSSLKCHPKTMHSPAATTRQLNGVEEEVSSLTVDDHLVKAKHGATYSSEVNSCKSDGNFWRRFQPFKRRSVDKKKVPGWRKHSLDSSVGKREPDCTLPREQETNPTRKSDVHPSWNRDTCPSDDQKRSDELENAQSNSAGTRSKENQLSVERTCGLAEPNPVAFSSHPVPEEVLTLGRSVNSNMGQGQPCSPKQDESTTNRQNQAIKPDSIIKMKTTAKESKTNVIIITRQEAQDVVFHPLSNRDNRHCPEGLCVVNPRVIPVADSPSPTIITSKETTTTISKLSDVPKDLSGLSVSDVIHFLQLLNLGQYVHLFREHHVDGELLVCLDQDVLVQDFGLKKFDAIKLFKFARDGWRPRLETKTKHDGGFQ